MKKISFVLSIIMIIACFTGCAKKNNASDYSKAENWLAMPTSTDKKVDVFYLYPTCYNKSDKEPNVATIDNAKMRKISNYAMKIHATAFETVANIYAPYYRQADASYCLSLSEEKQDELLGGITKSDVFAAFDYYIKNKNNGRPFILAGHSQGSNMLLYLLSEYMEKNPEVYSRMVAAYVIGYSVTDKYLAENPHLKFAENADDTGVIISYNTQAKASGVTNPVVRPGALVINPITWTRDETLATAEQNLGSLILTKEKKLEKIMNCVDARVDIKNGVLVCSTVDAKRFAPGNEVFGPGVYHSFDYVFYYYDLRYNAENRVANFLSK